MVMIQMEEIKKYVKKVYVLRHNMIKLYGLIWGQCYTSLQSEMEGDPDYITYVPKYDFL